MMISIGTRIYNKGDMSNRTRRGVITAEKSDDFGTWVDVQYDDGSADHMPKSEIGTTFAGHAGTRIVTEAAYDEYRSRAV